MWEQSSLEFSWTASHFLHSESVITIWRRIQHRKEFSMHTLPVIVSPSLSAALSQFLLSSSIGGCPNQIQLIQMNPQQSQQLDKYSSFHLFFFFFLIFIPCSSIILWSSNFKKCIFGVAKIRVLTKEFKTNFFYLSHTLLGAQNQVTFLADKSL